MIAERPYRHVVDLKTGIPIGCHPPQEKNCLWLSLNDSQQSGEPGSVEPDDRFAIY
jgi:hypothetical protein